MSRLQTAAVVHTMDERIHDKENAAPVAMGGDSAAKQGALPRVLRSGGAVRTTSATTEMAPSKISPSPLQVRAGVSSHSIDPSTPGSSHGGW
jgi:hypothetical protein